MVHHCLSLFIIVHHNSSLFTMIHHCSSLFTIVHHCSSLFTIVHHHRAYESSAGLSLRRVRKPIFYSILFYIIVHHCLPWFTMIHHCLPLFIIVHHCSSLFTMNHHCSSLFTMIHHCSSLFTIVHCSSLFSTVLVCYISLHLLTEFSTVIVGGFNFIVKYSMLVKRNSFRALDHPSCRTLTNQKAFTLLFKTLNYIIIVYMGQWGYQNVIILTLSTLLTPFGVIGF